jgi:hypothetical protein
MSYLEPWRRGAAVWKGRGRNTLAGSMHSTHVGSVQRRSESDKPDKKANRQLLDVTEIAEDNVELANSFAVGCCTTDYRK